MAQAHNILLHLFAINTQHAINIIKGIFGLFQISIIDEEYVLTVLGKGIKPVVTIALLHHVFAIAVVAQCISAS